MQNRTGDAMLAEQYPAGMAQTVTATDSKRYTLADRIGAAIRAFLDPGTPLRQGATAALNTIRLGGYLDGYRAGLADRPQLEADITAMTANAGAR